MERRMGETLRSEFLYRLPFITEESHASDTAIKYLNGLHVIIANAKILFKASGVAGKFDD
jgi:hypothetical protein